VSATLADLPHATKVGLSSATLRIEEGLSELRFGKVIASCFPLHENVSFGSLADGFLPGGVGFWLLGRSPRFAATAVANTLTVATPLIFIDSVDPNRSWRSPMQSRTKIQIQVKEQPNE
jgi:hypothetical protein